MSHYHLWCTKCGQRATMILPSGAKTYPLSGKDGDSSVTGLPARPGRASKKDTPDCALTWSRMHRAAQLFPRIPPPVVNYSFLVRVLGAVDPYPPLSPCADANNHERRFWPGKFQSGSLLAGERPCGEGTPPCPRWGGAPKGPPRMMPRPGAGSKSSAPRMSENTPFPVPNIDTTRCPTCL